MQPDDDALVEQVGRRIGELRAVAGKTQAEVAEALGMTVSNYQRIEHGFQNITLKTLFKIARVIGAAPNDLLVGPEHPRAKRGRPRKRA